MTPAGRGIEVPWGGSPGTHTQKSRQNNISDVVELSCLIVDRLVRLNLGAALDLAVRKSAPPESQVT
jgi:hypothetical protein